MKRAIWTALLVLGVAGGTAHGAVLVAWDVEGVDVADGTGIDESSSPFTFTAGTRAGNISDAELTLSSAVNPSTSADQYGFKISAGDEETTLAGAITSGHYLQFTIEVASGYQVNLTSIEMNGESTGTGADDVALLSSVDGFSAGNEIDSVTNIQDVTGGFDTDSSGFGAAIDLSASKYQGLTGTTTFRLYGYNTSGGTGVTRLRSLSGDDLVINGGVSVIPEPATMGMLFLGVGGLLYARRRTRG